MELQPAMLGRMTRLTGSARRLAQSRFARNVVTAASGTAAVQLIGAAFAPLLTRQYGPAAYGALGAFMALSVLLTNAAGLTYPVAMVLPAEDRKAKYLAALALVVATIMATILGLVLLVWGDRIALDLGLADVEGIALMLPAAVVLITGLSVARQWLIRKGRFSTIAKVGVVQALLVNGAKAMVGAVAPSATALVAMAAFAPGLYVALLAGRLKDPLSSSRVAGLCGNEERHVHNLRQVALEYRDFPLYRAPQHLLNSFGMAVPMLLLASTFGSAAAGYYAITQTVMGLPSILIGKAVGDVFYPRVAESIRVGRRADQEIVRATGALLAAGAVPFGLILLAGPTLFGFVFGEEWEQSGQYARWLVPLFLLNLANKPAVAAIAPLGQQGKLLVYEVLATIAKCAGFLCGFFWLGEPLAAVALFSLAGSGAYVVLIVYVVIAARRAAG